MKRLLPVLLGFPLVMGSKETLAAAANEAVFLRPLTIKQHRPKQLITPRETDGRATGDYLINGDGKIYQYRPGSDPIEVCDLRGELVAANQNDWLCRQLGR
jgi:hypothetical protein